MKAQITIARRKEKFITETKGIYTENPIGCIAAERMKDADISYEEVELQSGEMIPNTTFAVINLINTQNLEIEEIKDIVDECMKLNKKIERYFNKTK